MLRRDDLDLMRRGTETSGGETDTAGAGDVYVLAAPVFTVDFVVVVVVVVVGIGGGGGGEEVGVAVVVGAVAGEVVDPENKARMDTNNEAFYPVQL